MSKTLAIGTSSLFALTRSTSAKICGVEARNGENTAVSSGSWWAASTSAVVASCSAPMPRPPRSCTSTLKPPAVPRPRTGGGAITKMSASVIWFSSCCSVVRSSSAVGPCVRSSNGSCTTKIAPALALLARVAPEKPANATACRTPGVWRITSLAWRTTSSVRSSDAPSGSWIATIR